MTKKVFASDTSYKQMTTTYDAKDALLAILLYFFLIFAYLGMGILQATRGIYLGVPLSLSIVVICIALVLVRKQKLNSIGLTLKNLRKSLILGLVAGVCLSLLTNVLPTILSGGHWRELGFSKLVEQFLYYVVVAGFTEKLLFRSYIQTRLYGFIKSDVVAVLVCALMFMAFHVPYQLYNRSGGNFMDFLTNDVVWLLTTLVWHIVFNFIYRKYNSVIAGSVCPGLIDFSSILFK